VGGGKLWGEGQLFVWPLLLKERDKKLGWNQPRKLREGTGERQTTIGQLELPEKNNSQCGRKTKRDREDRPDNAGKQKFFIEKKV